MGCFRIPIIPVFLLLCGREETKWEYYAAFFVPALSCLTDFLDGII
ncbi:CDP-alcohol phosphatidyltransferase family protein [Fusibacillus kribbianus]